MSPSTGGRRGGRTRRAKFFIVTGVSGAGKSQALKAFEDFGFFCVDNLPVSLLDQFADHVCRSRALKQVALGMDIREGRWLDSLPKVLESLKGKGIEPRILFLDASDAAVIQRFSETRHRHPLGKKLSDAIHEERRRLVPVKALADKVIDTSVMTLGELKEKLSETLQLTRPKEMTLSVVSFGYKYGLPMDADIVMDVRFLPNPNYEPRLKRLTGLYPRVGKFILNDPNARKFLDDYLQFILKLLPYYVREGKSYLTIAVGCTGGRHRSVFVTHHLAGMLQRSGHLVQEFHRDSHRAG
ncbi:MAG: RNase adapter RapZ [Elusimicrobia bacterium]|nr:RNase adapter RapZ [Elusimicrobiota bacterium]